MDEQPSWFCYFERFANELDWFLIELEIERMEHVCILDRSKLDKPRTGTHMEYYFRSTG